MWAEGDCQSLRHHGTKMDDFDKVMTLVVLFGIGLAGFLAYGSRRLNQLEAELRRQTDQESCTEASGKSGN